MPKDERAQRVAVPESAAKMTGPDVGGIPLVWHQMADPIGQPTDLHRAWCPLFKQHFWAESADRIPKIEARRAARIMAVIEIKESVAP